MSKRFTDTEKYKKGFIRSLPGAYKLFWDYLYHDCDFAGVWHVDFEVAQIYLGSDMPINKELSLKYFNDKEERVVILNSGSRWLIVPFIAFQYGRLNPANRVHSSVLDALSREGLQYDPYKGLISPLQGAKEKEKDSSSSLSSSYIKSPYSPDFMEFWKAYPGNRKTGKHTAYKSWQSKKPPLEKCLQALSWQVKSDQWMKSDPQTGEKGAFIPLPSTWINQGRWEDVSPNHTIVTCRKCGAEGILPKGVSGEPICRKCKEAEVTE